MIIIIGVTTIAALVDIIIVVVVAAATAAAAATIVEPDIMFSNLIQSILGVVFVVAGTVAAIILL